MSLQLEYRGPSSRETARGRRGTLAVLMVLLMTLSAAAPIVSAAGAETRQPYAPDLYIDESSVAIAPLPLTQGVPAVVHFIVGNMGEQAAFDLEVLMRVGATEIKKPILSLPMNTTTAIDLNWTPMDPGQYDIDLITWYGATSAKLDMDWTNNNVTVPVDVRSRPDAQVLDSEMRIYRGALENPPYITDGETLDVRITVHNLGTADIQSCNVSLWETMGSGAGSMMEKKADLSVPGSGSIPLVFSWNTTGWAGKRTLVINVTDVYPYEADRSNNKASRTNVKIHTKEDLIFAGTSKETIDTAYKVNFFITIREDASLTVLSTGNATVYQDFPEQFDIEVADRAQLVLDGGLLTAALNYTIYLSGTAKLTIKGGATTTLRIVSSGGSVVLEGSNLSSPSITMRGGSLSIEDARLVTPSISLTNTGLDIVNSSLELGDTLVLSGRTTTIKDTHVMVRRQYDTFAEALEVFPQLENYDPVTLRVDTLPPAILADAGAVIDLINVSANSTVFSRSEKTEYWTNNRLGARGATSIINVYRYLEVSVVEWSGKVVPGAHVKVLDYFGRTSVAEGDSGPDGTVSLVVMTDYIKENLKPFVGNLEVYATLGTQSSAVIRFSHFKYPQMEFDVNVYHITIVLPPSDAPADPSDHVIYYRTKDESISGGIDRVIIIDNYKVTVKDADLILEQDRAFQWYILVRGTKGVLELENATLGSPYPFVVYLQGNAKLVASQGSSLLNVRVVAFDQSTVSIQGSAVSGDIWAQCSNVELVDSHLSVIDARLEATKVTIDGGSVMAERGLHVQGHQVEVKDVDVTNYYRLATIGVRDMRQFVHYFGWAKLDELGATTNLSLLYFNFEEYSKGVNITIEGDLVTFQNAFIYAAETTVQTYRNPNSDQLKIADSWVGGGTLTILSDDLHADGASFNHVLDGFSAFDHVNLYDVQMPGVVCAENATANRYWYLTVHAIDGAGSVRPGALLEVVSTETNKTLVDNVRTNDAGTVTVPILANQTDRTGDYFVGSIRFRLVFDQLQFKGAPTYTAWERVALKDNLELTLRFAETIESPMKDVRYLVYNFTEIGPTGDLKIYYHTFGSTDAAWAFFNDTVDLQADRARIWDVVRGTKASMTLAATALINDVWVPLEGTQGAIVRVYILNETRSADAVYTNAHINSDDKRLYWEVWPDVKGNGRFDLDFPDSVGPYHLYIEVSGGTYDPVFQVERSWMWNFTVVEPKTIEIYGYKLEPTQVSIGEIMTVTGVIRYIFTGLGVNASEITVSGQHITTLTTRSRENGAFTISLQAPMVPGDTYSMTIVAVDPVTEQSTSIDINYNVVTPPTVGPSKETPWVLIYILVIIVVMVAAIGGGAVLFLRKQWGKLVECGECGAFIPANSAKCPKCGVEFETDLARCSECEAWIPADSPSCPVCGTPFTIEVLEKQVAAEEAAAIGKPVDEVTTTSAKIPPLSLGTVTPAKWTDKDETRRRRIKKRVKKRLTVADSDAAVDAGGPAEEATDLYVGEADQGVQPTRLPGIDVGEESLSEDELSRLLPTEDMLKELMLTTEKGAAAEAEPEEGEAGAEAKPEDGQGAPKAEALEEIPQAQAPPKREAELEEIPSPKKPEPVLQRVPLGGPVEEEKLEELEPVETETPGELEGETEVEDEGLLLRELGLKPEASKGKPKPKPPAPKAKRPLGVEEEEAEAPAAGGEEGMLGDILTEKPEREAPKLCPNCGGNWILYKGGEYTCRICGEKW